MKEPIPEIHEIVEVEDDEFGSVCGYYCYGHVDKQQFAIECNKEFDLSAQEKPVYTSAVEHGYLIKTFEDQDGEALGGSKYLLYKSSPQSAGAFPATYVW